LTVRTKALLAWVAGVLISSAASAHPMLLLGAELTVSGDALRINLRATDADLDHLRIDPAREGARADFANLVGASLVVVDDRGERIAMEATGDAALVGRIGNDATAVSLRIDPDSPLAIRGGQVQIRTALRETPLRLSRAGNAETVRLGRVPAPTERGEAWLWRERFEGICALVSREGDEVMLDVVAPVAVVETWMSLPRVGRESIDPVAAQGALDAFGGALLGGVTIRDAGGARVGRVGSATLLGPSSTRADAQSGPLGAAGACVWVRLAYRDVPSDGEATLTWDAFNAAVHRVRVYAPGVIDASATRSAPTLAIPAALE
jgi:hypothetical protein